jgi:hypothetical protein
VCSPWAFFALHPAAAEVVSWVTGRKDLLAALFGLLALHLSTVGSRAEPRASTFGSRAESRPSTPTRVGRVGALLSYLLALLSKPVAAPFALLIPLFTLLRDRDSARRSSYTRALLETLPYLLVLLPVLWLGSLGQERVGASGRAELEAEGLSHARRALFALGHHLRLALLLEEPTVKYLPEPWPPAWPSSNELFALAGAALLGLVLWRLRGTQARAVWFGTALAVLGYLPSSSLFFPLTRFLADTYVYLPLLGLGLVFGALFDALVQRVASARLRPTLRAVPWLLCCALVPAFLGSSARFADDLALWSHAMSRFSHPRVCREFANAVARQEGPLQGLAAVDACIARHGDRLFLKNRGLLLNALGRRAEALEWLRRAQNVEQPAPPSRP